MLLNLWLSQIFGILLVLLLALAPLRAENVVLTMDAAQRGPTINPRLYGIFLEEINHGVDGGLYGELVRNRAFEDSRPPEGYAFRNGRWRDAHGFDSGFSRYGYTTNGVPFWSLVQDGAAKGEMHLETTGGVTEQSAYCLRLDVRETPGGRLGVANGGFFGIGVRDGERYALSLFAKRNANFDGSLTVRLEDKDGAACSDEAKFEKLRDHWQTFRATLTAAKTDSKARLVILARSERRSPTRRVSEGDNAQRAGSEAGAPAVCLDFVSLFPETTWRNRTNGLRPDIAQMIADLQPGFVRFPGGCVIEGGTVETAYNWKLTVGPLPQREERWGPWNYRQTHGLGLFEYLQFIEDLGAEPLWVGFGGQTCHFRGREDVPMSEMGWVRDNFLDLVEYANGSTDTTWGGLRAQAGHLAPFGLKHVEISNESEGPEFVERYRFIHDAMKAKYTDLTYIADLSFMRRDLMRDAPFDIEDSHHYSSPRWFLSRFHEYDERDRKLPPLYLGEVAVTSREAGPLRGNLLAALAEGVFLLGCERNADVVRMVSYAPLLAHVEGRTELIGAPPPWHGQIYFDGTRVFGTASYYLWKLLSRNRPSCTIKTDVTFPGAKPVVIAGQVGVGTWDATAEFKDIRVERDGRAIYASEFTNAAEGWKPDGGQWSIADGVYRQTRRGQGLSYFGDENWSDYTLGLRARKLSGGEGFLIVFGRSGGEKYWWNLGGWANSQHALEFNQTPVGQPVRGRIESERWYDIKIALNGQRIRCYLDGELIHDVTAPSTQKFFAVAGRDDATGDVVLKAINVGDDKISATLKLSGVPHVAGDATLTVLQSASLSDNNSLEEPTRLLPKESRLENASADFAHEFPARSLTVLRLKTR